jgi:hypothetical protein
LPRSREFCTVLSFGRTGKRVYIIQRNDLNPNKEPQR